MKTKLVLWGTKEEKKVLVALALAPKENVVHRWIVPEATATEDLYKALMAEWREGKDIEFPEDTAKDVIELTASGTLIPEDVLIEKGDVIQRAQTEWHFVVLSTKLSEQYANEVEALEEKVGKLTAYQQESWDELKGFWGKVQEQIRDRTLLRNHANDIREKTNKLFAKLKELRAAKDAEFIASAQGAYNKLETVLVDIEERIANNGDLYRLFEDLKKLQNQFRNAKLTRELRGQIWARLDGAFKTVKEKRFGPSSNANSNSPSDRISRRYQGLMSAIEKMNRSIKRDKDELSFQNKKINSVNAGQLEMQIRQAKVNMIKDRISSKAEKLAEMMKTKIELEDKLEQIKAKEAKRAEAQKAREEAAAKKAAEEAAKKAAEAEKAAAETPTEEVATEETPTAEPEATVEEVAPEEEASVEAEPESADVEAEAPTTEEAEDSSEKE